MNYKITPQNGAKDFSRQILDKLEDFLFCILKKFQKD